MNIFGNPPKNHNLDYLKLFNTGRVFWNLPPAELVEETLFNNLGMLTNTGALAINTGEFTGRAPKDRFIVEDDITREKVWWGSINKPFDPRKFDALFNKLTAYLINRDLYIRDAFVGVDPKYRTKIRVINEIPWANMFAYNMFLRPTAKERAGFEPEWHVIQAPGFHSNPEEDGTRQHNFSIINFTQKLIIIGGTGYTGEIKKGVFSVLNFILPDQKNVLPMHCSANVGKEGDTAIFFGLSGTGKTTLSSDTNRRLIGDDEHGWADGSVFNFEGGCYAKTIDLSEKREPQIYHAIKFGALLENVGFKKGTVEVNYSDSSITENTRVSYPIEHIDNIMVPSIGNVPKNIFFLTADAFGTLPPISKLNKSQAMYQFISGYTAKVAGTEDGIDEPVAAFSACFGGPFMPMHPTVYAKMLGEKMEKFDVKVWLVNTGWTGGPYGIGSRIKLKYTRAMITAAINGELDEVEYTNHPVFGLEMPTTCPDVPDDILDPKNTWKNKRHYDKKADELANLFVENFKKFEEFANAEIMAASPKV
jgi:phosphoenolpyruvate carboxykinase (ATP)